MYLLEIGSQSLLYPEKSDAVSAFLALSGKKSLAVHEYEFGLFKDCAYYKLRLTEVKDSCYTLTKPTLSEKEVPF